MLPWRPVGRSLTCLFVKCESQGILLARRRREAGQAALDLRQHALGELQPLLHVGQFVLKVRHLPREVVQATGIHARS